MVKLRKLFFLNGFYWCGNRESTQTLPHRLDSFLGLNAKVTIIRYLGLSISLQNWGSILSEVMVMKHLYESTKISSRLQLKLLWPGCPSTCTDRLLCGVCMWAEPWEKVLICIINMFEKLKIFHFAPFNFRWRSSPCQLMMTGQKPQKLMGSLERAARRRRLSQTPEPDGTVK